MYDIDPILHHHRLAARERARIAKTLTLLASDKPGEVLAAAAAASRLLELAGLSWARLLGPPPAPHREPLRSVWRDICRQLSARPEELRPWERKFCADLPNFRMVSSKQRYILSEIADRVLGREASR